MNKYLENIKSLESAGTSVQHGQNLPDSTTVIEMSGQAPTITNAGTPKFAEEISQEFVSYSAPQKVIVRTYRLRK